MSSGPGAGARFFKSTPLRMALLLPGGIALVGGLDAALLLLGLPAPVTAARLPQIHGVLLVLGFVGTVIALERAVAWGRPVGYLAPVSLGIGGILLLSPAPLRAGQAVLLAGTLAMAALYLPLWKRQRDNAVLIQILGAVAAIGAAALWLRGFPVPALPPWLAAFVILTIVGERLELARIDIGSVRAEAVLVWLASAMLLILPATLLWPAVGFPLLGASTAALVLWLSAYDVGRRTIRSTGLPRYITGCLLIGYGWLLVAAVIWLLGPGIPVGAAYDASVHAVFLGFTLSMIMAHAPVILPAVLRRPLPYHPVFMVPAALLHASLLLRLLWGDGYGLGTGLQLGGGLNILAVLGFVLLSIWAAATAGRQLQRRAGSNHPKPSGAGNGGDEGHGAGKPGSTGALSVQPTTLSHAALPELTQEPAPELMPEPMPDAGDRS